MCETGNCGREDCPSSAGSRSYKSPNPAYKATPGSLKGVLAGLSVGPVHHPLLKSAIVLAHSTSMVWCHLVLPFCGGKDVRHVCHVACFVMSLASPPKVGCESGFDRPWRNLGYNTLVWIRFRGFTLCRSHALGKTLVDTSEFFKAGSFQVG